MSEGIGKSPNPRFAARQKVRCIMSNNAKMTRAQALEFAIQTIRDYEGDCEAIEILSKMHEQVTKPRKRAEGPTKVQRANAALAAAAVAAIREKGEPVTSKWICEHVTGIMTPQKCTAVMRIAIENGEAEKHKDGKAVTYTA